MANEQKNKSIGEVKIAADVVAAIAGLAATEDETQTVSYQISYRALG